MQPKSYMVCNVTKFVSKDMFLYLKITTKFVPMNIDNFTVYDVTYIVFSKVSLAMLVSSKNICNRFSFRHCN